MTPEFMLDPLTAAGLAHAMKMADDATRKPEPEPIPVALLRPYFTPPEGEPIKAIPTQWVFGDKVRKIGGDPLEWGWIRQITHNPGNAVYTVTWVPSGEQTHHYGFELEDAE